MRNWVFIVNFETITLRMVMGCLFLWAPLLFISYRLVYVPYILMCLITIPIHKFRTLERSNFPIIGLILLFVFWCGISIFWSPNRHFALMEFVKVVPILLGSISLFCYFKTLSREQNRIVIHSFLAGVLFIFYLMLVDHFMGFELSKWKKWDAPSMAKTYQFSVLILVLSLGLLLSQQKIRSWMLVPGTFLTVVLLYVFLKHYDYDAGPISLIFFLGTFLCVLILPRIVPLIIRYGLVFLLLASPLIIHTFLSPPVWQAVLKKEMEVSYRQRLEITEWGVNLIYSKPVIGYGIGQVRSLNAVSRPRNYGSPWPEEGVSENDISRRMNKQGEGLIDPTTGQAPLYWTAQVWHMHNGFMQMWVELGAVGILLMTVFIFLGLKGMDSFRVSRFQRAFYYGFISALLLIFSVSFGLWETWWLSTIIILIFLYYLNFRVHETRSYS